MSTRDTIPAPARRLYFSGALAEVHRIAAALAAVSEETGQNLTWLSALLRIEQARIADELLRARREMHSGSPAIH